MLSSVSFGDTEWSNSEMSPEGLKTGKESKRLFRIIYLVMVQSLLTTVELVSAAVVLTLENLK